jgi:hypothetical protein
MHLSRLRRLVCVWISRPVHSNPCAASATTQIQVRSGPASIEPDEAGRKCHQTSALAWASLNFP